MKSQITLAALFCTQIVLAQDYYSISNAGGNLTMYYPRTVVFEIVDGDSARAINAKDIEQPITGDFMLSIQVPWKSEKEYLNTGREQITISKITHTEHSKGRSKSVNPSPDITPEEISRSVENSSTFAGRKNLNIRFSNGLTFSLQEGKVEASERGIVLPVQGNYLVRYSEGLLKISFDQETGETWYVFEK